MQKSRRIITAKIFTVLAIAAVLLQLLAAAYVFQYRKEGEHSDELWGYGLANSYYEPYIFMSADTYETTYENEWVEGNVFKDYITVNENQRFAYGSVLSNLKKDTAPPLYYLLLHTVCSFFPGTFSLWYGFSINLAAFAVAQLFLYKLVKRITGEDYWALLTVVLYGFSVGAVSTAIFIRHYMLLTMFTVMTLYFHYRILNGRKERAGKERAGKETFGKILPYAGLCISVAGGALSHYFYFVFLAVFAVLYLLYYCLKKEWRKAGAYLAATAFPVLVTSLFSNVKSVLGLGAAVRGTESLNLLGAAVHGTESLKLLESGFFSGIIGLFSRVFNIAYDPMFDVNVNIVLECMLHDLLGITIEVNLPYWFFHLLYLAVFVLFLLLMLSVLAKKHGAKEHGTQNAEFSKTGAKEHKAEEHGTEENGTKTGGNGKRPGRLEKLYDRLAGISVNRFFVLTLLAAAAFEIYIVIGIAQPFRMNASTNRYLFMVYPAVYLLFMLALYMIMRKKPAVRAQAAAAVLVAVILLVNNVGAESIYLFPRPEGEPRMEDMVSGSDCVLMVSTHWLMTCYVNYLKEAEEIFVTDCVSVYEQTELLRQADTEEVYLVLDVDEFENTLMLKYRCEREEVSRSMAEECYMSFFEEVFEGKTIEYLSKDTVFQRNVYIYKVY